MAPPDNDPLAGLAFARSPGGVELLPAKINDRFIAYVIDAAPFAAGYFGTLYYLVMMRHAAPYSPQLDHRIGLAWAAAYLLYQFIGNATGATVGKRLMGLRIVRKDGQPLGVFGALLRAIGYVVSAPLSWGFVFALAHPESRAIHDLLCGGIVIERERKNQAESVLLFISATIVLIAMYAVMIWSNLNRITEKDLLAIEKAKDGLNVIAQVEEAYKATHPAYAKSLQDLADASGNADQFRASMAEIFDPNQFAIEAGNRGYRISGVARDGHHTRLVIAGPPPVLE